MNHSKPVRKIIHLDCDCFYAAVEMRDNPSLKDKPVAVGGRPELRGVIATCNYIARKFGIHSAMATAQAISRCPSLVLIAPNMDKYGNVSRQIMDIYHHYTDLVEPLSLDEAYLDVTNAPFHQGSATRIAQEIRQKVVSEIGITVSAGVAPNKFLAKIASDWQKPDGMTVISPKAVAGFIETLPIDKLFGVGPVTAKKLHAMNMQTCKDLQSCPLPALVHHFGRFGQTLYELAHGIDERPVQPHRQRKSVSVERTFAHDLRSENECIEAITHLMDDLIKRIQRAKVESIAKLFVKIRFSDFSITTMECIENQLNVNTFVALFKQAVTRHHQAVRLLGIGIRIAPPSAASCQLSLFSQESSCSG